MAFLAPLGLLALITLPIIIILHLRRERLRRVAVPSLMLWQQVPTTTGRERKLILPRTLLLLLHLLVAALLALALGQPQFLGRLLASSAQHLIVVIDTSTSMAAREGLTSNRLAEARERVHSLIDNLNGNDTLSLIAAGSQARLLATGTIGNRAGLLAALDQLEPIGTGTAIASALALAQVAHESSLAEGTGRIVVLSDQAPPQDAALPAERVEWVRVGNTTNNQAIVALSARPRHGGTAGYDVYARIANYDSRSAVRTVRLFADDEQLDARGLDIRPTGETDLTWEVPEGTRILRLQLDGSDALSLDDTALVSLEQSRSLAVVLVSAAPQANPFLIRVLNTLPNVTLTVLDALTYATAPQASSADLTIFDGIPPGSLPTGGVLIIGPPPGSYPLLTVEAPPIAEPAASTEAVQEVSPTPDDESNPLYGLSLGSVDFGTVPIIQPPDWAHVQLTRATQPLVLRGTVGGSEVAIWAFDLLQGNLTSRLAFPLLVARTVADVTTPAPPVALLVGQPFALPLNPRTDTVEVVDPAGETQEIAITGTLHLDNVNQPGLYQVREYSGNSLVYTGQFTINAGTPLESDLRPQPLPSIGTPYIALDDATTSSGDGPAQHATQPIWPWLALAALMVLLFEWVYVHWR